LAGAFSCAMRNNRRGTQSFLKAVYGRPKLGLSDLRPLVAEIAPVCTSINSSGILPRLAKRWFQREQTVDSLLPG